MIFQSTIYSMQSNQPKPIKAVLFDLDGTMLDTAPDLSYALNQLRAHHHLPKIPTQVIRPNVGLGTRALIKLGFNLSESDQGFETLRKQFLDLYQAHIADKTRFFPEIPQVLDYLEEQGIPWGIVTNKPQQLTHDLLRALHFESRPECIVCGDTLSTIKPEPDTLLYACKLLKKAPEACVYIGDTKIDVMASKAAGILSLIVLYGYTTETDDPFSWHADGYITKPLEIIAWLKKRIHK